MKTDQAVCRPVDYLESRGGKFLRIPIREAVRLIHPIFLIRSVRFSEIDVRVVICLLMLGFPFFSVAESSCEKLNESVYRSEVRVESPGAIYKVHFRSGVFVYFAPDELCRGASFLASGDKVQVYSEYGAYMSAMYFRRDGSTVEGWVQKKYLIRTKGSVSPSE